MLDLDPEQQLFIVQHLATYHSNTQVRELFKETYSGIELTPQVISSYNPATVAGGRMSEHLKAAYAEARHAYQTSTADLAILNRNFRSRRLGELLEDSKVRKNPKITLEIFRFIEQVEGGMFSKAQRQDDGAEGLAELRKALGVTDGGSADDGSVDVEAAPIGE